MSTRRPLLAFLVSICALGATLLLAAQALAAAVPTIEEESFTSVGSSSATLRAQLNAQGVPSSFYFEYGTTVAYGSKTPVTSFGAANGAVGVLAQVELEPDKTYHFRVVASNEAGVIQGGDTTFTTSAVNGLTLPDGRGYELVTPVENYQANVYAPDGLSGGAEEGISTRLPFQAAADGNAVAYLAGPTIGGNGSEGPGFGNEYLARRSSARNWAQVNLQPPGYPNPTYQGFSSDLSVSFLGACEPLTSDAPSGTVMLYERNNQTESYRALLGSIPQSRQNFELEAHGVYKASISCDLIAYAGSSSVHDALFEVNAALTSNAVEGGTTANNLYDSVEGRLSLVNVLPDGQSEANATFGPPNDVGPGYGTPFNFSHVISDDGSRIYWTDLNNGNLYLRERAASNDAATVQVDASQGSGPGGGGHFWTASGDGSKVFFTDADTAGLTTDTLPGSGQNLYEYEAGDGHLTDITASAQAAVEGVIGASDDGEYAYFVADGAIAPGAVGGQPNLYLWHHGVTSFIATLAPRDGDEIQPYGFGYGDLAPGPGGRTARVSSDGHGLVFMSSQSLTGYPNDNMAEVYAYEAESGTLACVSCNSSGEPPPIQGEQARGNAGGLLPVAHSNTYQPRIISEDGSRVFFVSPEPLVPQDNNAREDVYEWERDGAGSCHSATGCVSLLSEGSSTASSWLIDASASGDDVFITTRAQLSPADQNDNYDLYDVSVGATEAAAPPACAGTGCQGVPSAPPIFATPASVTFAGAGNFSAPSQAKAKGKKAKPTRRPKRKKRKKVGKKGKKAARSAKASRKSNGRGRR
jgi:hypothetical protein